MNALSLVRCLSANHSVREMTDRGRRMVLPNGPAFPQFSRSAPRFVAPLTPSPAVVGDPNRGASFSRSAGTRDIFDDDDASAAEHHKRVSGGVEALKHPWLVAAGHFFGVTRKS